jgi:hypothetical protein
MQVAFASSTALGTMTLPPISALMVMPFIDAVAARRSALQLAERAGCDGLILAIHDDDRQGFVATVNQAFRRSQSRLFGFTAQDAFAGRDWLARADRAMTRSQARLLAFNDGKWFGALAAFGLADRAWANGNYGGDFFYPGYHSHYADTELTILARAKAVLAYDPEAVLIEVDWDKSGKSVRREDQSLYRARAGQGFDGRVSDKILLEGFR